VCGRGTLHDRDAMQSREIKKRHYICMKGRLQSITEQTAQGSIFHQPLSHAHKNEWAMDAEGGSWSHLIVKHRYARKADGFGRRNGRVESGVTYSRMRTMWNRDCTRRQSNKFMTRYFRCWKPRILMRLWCCNSGHWHNRVVGTKSKACEGCRIWSNNIQRIEMCGRCGGAWAWPLRDLSTDLDHTLEGVSSLSLQLSRDGLKSSCRQLMATLPIWNVLWRLRR